MVEKQVVKIIVKGYLGLQEALGGKSLVEVETAAATIREVLDDLSQRFGRGFIERIFDLDTGEPARDLMLLVNGHNYLSLPAKLDTDLKDGDELSFFSPVAGG
jgi:MoaD family protein